MCFDLAPYEWDQIKVNRLIYKECSNGICKCEGELKDVAYVAGLIIAGSVWQDECCAAERPATRVCSLSEV